jgi:hypothetical protein
MENVLKSEDVVRYLDAKHIRIQNSAPYSHWQQSVERDIQTIVKGTSCLLHDQEFLNATYWDHAMVHFVDVRGHVPNKVLGDRSPMQVITQRTTNVGNRYKFFFGEPVLLTIVLPDHVSKFDPRNDMAIYLGDPEGQVDSHIVLLPYYHRVITRSGATSLDITSEQFAKFYSERL